MRLIPLLLLVAGCEDDLLANLDAPVGLRYSTCVLADTTDVPQAGVEFSVVDRPELPTSATTDNGCVELAGLPANDRLLVTWAKAGFGTRMRTFDSGTGDFEFGLGPLHKEYLYPESAHAAFEAASGLTVDWSAPIAAVFVRETGKGDTFLPDVTIASPSVATPTCYRRKDYALGCAQPADNIGVGRMYNLTPGTIEVTVSSTDGTPLTCAPSGADWHTAWPAAAANTFTIPLRAATETMISIDCHR